MNSNLMTPGIQKTAIHTFLFLSALLIRHTGLSQSPFPQDLQLTEIAPNDILASRAVVLHDYKFSDKELEEIQKAFQQIGIDAVAYFETDVVLAGKDVTKAFAEYFVTRQVRYLIFFEKMIIGYRFTVVLFDQKSSLFDAAQPAWRHLRLTPD